MLALLLSALVISALVSLAAGSVLLAYVVHLSRHKKSSRRPLGLLGRAATVERSLEPEGFVLVEGELWRARVRGGAGSALVKTKVRVVGASGCVLEVEPLV